MSGEKKRGYSRKKINGFSSGKRVFSQESGQTEWQSQGHPHIVCAASDSTVSSAVQRHEIILWHNICALITSAFHATHQRNLRQLNLANYSEIGASEVSDINISEPVQSISIFAQINLSLL